MCLGAGVPTAAARPVDGTPRTPVIIELPELGSKSPPKAQTPIRLDVGFDTVACTTITVLEPISLCRLGPEGPIQSDGSWEMGPVYTTAGTQVEVVVRDAASALEVGRFSRSFPRKKCGRTAAPHSQECATDWNVINGELLPLLLK